MMILRWSLLFILAYIVPYILGTLLVTHMDKSYQTPAMDYLCGWFLCFSIFEVVAVPFILLQSSFTMVVLVYSVITAILLVYAFIKRKRTIGNIFTRFKFGCFKFDFVTNLAWVVFFAIMLLQIWTMFHWAIYDGDDPYFIVIANMANTDDTMYTKDAYTGFVSTLDMRHAMSPTPLYYAYLARATKVHVRKIAHLILAPAFLALMYAVYAQIGKRLFKKNEKARPWFMILLSIWYCFGYVSAYTAETFAINRTWQGKAMIGNIVIPTVIWCLLMLGEKKQAIGVWVLLSMTSVVGVFCSSVAFMLVPTMIGTGAIILGIRKKSFAYFIKVGLCMVPCLILAGIYLVCK